MEPIAWAVLDGTDVLHLSTDYGEAESCAEDTGGDVVPLVPQQQWIRVTERSPEDGTWCWVDWPGSDGAPMVAKRDSHAAGGWTNEDTWEDFSKVVTSYVPLPAPPEVK